MEHDTETVLFGHRHDFGGTKPFGLGVSERQQHLYVIGHLVATPNALSVLAHDDIVVSLGRHVRGDWGELDSEDRNANERALLHGGRLFSVFVSTNQVKFWIITECDRSATTVLLPEDY
jgi:hypothetical protein